VTPYVRGWCSALIKLGLSDSALAATSGTTSGTKPGATTNTTTPAKQTKPWQWSAANNIEPKLHESAWSHAQKDLDTGEARVMAKFDASQRQPVLPVGSA
jgi:hypothetical protein